MRWSRHRGAEPSRRCGLLGRMSLLSPGYLLSVERPRFHSPRRITKPDFRPCSTCQSRSQAPLCLYTLRTVSNRTEGTFGRSRYILGGDRPSQTAHLTLSACPVRTATRQKPRTRRWYPKGGPPRLASRFTASHLFWTTCTRLQYQAAVKVHGIFRLSAGNRHLHRYYNFTESLVDSAQSLRHSCRSELTRQGISLPQDPL